MKSNLNGLLNWYSYLFCNLAILTYSKLKHNNLILFDDIKVESRLRETTTRLEQQLAEEQVARLKAEEMAHAAQTKSNDEIRKLRENLERAQKETEELRKRAESGKCAIL